MKNIEHYLKDLDKIVNNINIEQLERNIETDKEIDIMDKENDLKSLKTHIEEFINKYDIKYLGIDIQDIEELEYNAINNDSSNKIIRISIEY